MIIQCEHCGSINHKKIKTIGRAKCNTCGKKMLANIKGLHVPCPSCNMLHTGDIFAWKGKCKSCGHKIPNPLFQKCWGRTVNKGHNFKKFSCNLNHDELQWLKKTSASKKVQIGQIIRMLIRQEAGLIIKGESAEGIGG